MEPSTDIAEAREALAYWSRRADKLPWHRRAARREARELTARWRARLVSAHLERWRLGRIQPFLAPLLDTRGRSASAHVRRLAWVPLRRTAIGRRILFTLTAFTAVAVGSCALVALLLVNALTG